MTWGEAIRLTQMLTTDPSSRVCASQQRWDRPLSTETVVLLDLYDAFAQVNFKKPKPHHLRPREKSRRTRPSPSLTQAQIRKALRDAGHDIPDLPTT